jgi:hypothetical protein
MSRDHNHLNHATWECKYHVVFTPKYRKKALFGQIRRHLGTVFRELAHRKECRPGRGDDPRLRQKSGDRGPAVGSVATEARVLIGSCLLYQNPS